jgi:microcystin-dependent protein
MADVTINQLTPGTPSNAAVVPYSEGGITRSTTVSNFGVPIGAVFHLATSTVPTGYLKCNGDVVPNGSGTVQGITANFSVLYALLGATYGSLGKLPDLRGEFVRGFDDGRGIDVSRVMGSNQADAFQGHRHALVTGHWGINTSQYDSTWLTRYNNFYENTNTGDVYAGNEFSNGTNGTPRTASETRPRNVALMPVIKY